MPDAILGVKELFRPVRGHDELVRHGLADYFTRVGRIGLLDVDCVGHAVEDVVGGPSGGGVARVRETGGEGAEDIAGVERDLCFRRI